MVSVFSGQLTRTWLYNEDNGTLHTITLNHDTISGVRLAFLDYQEIVGSAGASSLLLDSKGHRIFFTIGRASGYIEIRRAGWTSFSYACVVNDRHLVESNSLPASSAQTYAIEMGDAIFTHDTETGEAVAWYPLTIQRQDGVQTTVHRRFCEFAYLNSQIKHNLKGTGLRKTLPTFPAKKVKFATNHEDPGFVHNRQTLLVRYLRMLTGLDFVVSMDCFKAFVGLFDHVREISFVFSGKLGMTLELNRRQDPLSPAIIQSIQVQENCEGIYCGDCVSKVNGESVAEKTFSETISYVTRASRPIVVHFIQVIAAPAPGTVKPLASAGATSSAPASAPASAARDPVKSTSTTPTPSSASSSSASRSRAGNYFGGRNVPTGGDRPSDFTVSSVYTKQDGYEL